MAKFIKSFLQIKKEDVAEAGGKGANLGEMAGSGITVPCGVVLLSSAYDRYMQANGIDTEDFSDAASIREKILSGSIPEEIETELTDFYRSLGEDIRLAVRSSATAEDLDDASFAGQQETYLNVIGLTEVLRKVKECYASLWGDRAVSYRKNSGYDKTKVALALVLQEMVESEAAGVMFTRDPAGDPGQIHINASYGLGEAVVSGMVSPDEYILSRDGKMVREIIGDKKTEIVYSGQGTVRREVEEARQKKRVLDEKTITELLREGLRIEEHYQKPMDIEWAVRDGRIYILQARSITTLGSPVKEFGDEDFRGLPLVKPAKGSRRESVLFNLEKMPMPYYPLDHDFGGNVGNQKGILFEKVGISFPEGMYPIRKDGINILPSDKMCLNRRIFGILKTVKKVNDIDANIRLGRESLTKCQRQFEKEKQKDPQTIAEVGRSLERMRKLIGKTAYDRFLYALLPNALQSKKVTKVLKKLVDGNKNSYDVLEGLSYVTADMNREMVRLCERINEDLQASKDIQNMDYTEICGKYPALKKDFEKFLSDFGSKSDYNCYCFVAKTWREEPERFLDALRPMLKGGYASVPTLEEGMEKFQAVMNKVKKSLTPDKYKRFEKNVEGLRVYHQIREASQYLWESEFEFCRKLLGKLAGFTGIDYGDLLYLFADELFEACEKGFGEKQYKFIKTRKDKRPLAEAYWNKSLEDALRTDEAGVKGIGASAGTVSGKVCLVRSPKEFGKLSKGDILVCKYTDPEWTPLFSLAAGVVVDTGGTLSHAAIVAREYHIPAILACGDATQKLIDGEKVIIDGGKGTVTRIRKNKV